MSHLGVTEYPNTFERQGAFPLDNTAVFETLALATEYAATNPIAYNGQIISVIENDEVAVYLLTKSDNDSENFKLVNIPISSVDINEAVIDMNALINSKVGIWSITKTDNENEAVLDFDISYGVDADSFEVLFNDELVSDRLNLYDEFLTSLEQFYGDSTNIKLRFFNDDIEAFELEAKAIYKNDTVIFGSLYLTKLS